MAATKVQTFEFTLAISGKPAHVETALNALLDGVASLTATSGNAWVRVVSVLPKKPRKKSPSPRGRR